MFSSKRAIHFGQWLFQRRSYLPALFAAIFVPAFSFFEYPRSHYYLHHYWEFWCLGISLFGLTIRILAVAHIAEGSSGRELSNPKASTLNTTGMYSISRNPLYLGNGFIWFGITALFRLWWLSLLMSLIFWVYYRLIIAAEEAYLRTQFGDAYSSWASRTPLLFPSFRSWQPPSLPFSWVMVVRREYSGLFQIFLAYAIMNLLLRHAVEGIWRVDPFWQLAVFVVSCVCTCIFVLLRRTNHLSAGTRAMPATQTPTQNH